MLFLRIRQAECALNDGRLDEAFDLLRAPDARNHYNGQRLVGRLIRLLVERGQTHLASGRFPQALSDCTKAEQLGGNLVEIAELKMAAARALEEKQQADRLRSLAVVKARECIDNGRASVGEKLLSEVTHDEQAKILLRELAMRRGAAESAVECVRRAMDRGDLVAAIEELIKTRNGHSLTGPLMELAQQVTSLGVQRVRSTLDQGRLDQAGTLLDPMIRLNGDHLEVRELRRILDQCRQAVKWAHDGQFSQAALALRQLGTLLPGAAWLKDAIGEAEIAAQGQEALLSGPLGLTSSGFEREGPVETKLPVKSRGETLLPEIFTISVDGVGSFLVVRRPRITLGPVSSSQRPTIGLMADASLPVVTIDRVEEDYFLRMASESGGESRLLRDGDQITLGPRCRMKFRLPHAASTSALLQLTNARLPQGDIRQVIFMDREIVFGPGPNAHIRADELPEAAALYVQNDRLCFRTRLPVFVNDQPEQAAGVGLDANVRLGAMSFVIKQYS